MNKSHKLTLFCGLALFAAMSCSAAFADDIDPQSLPGRNDGKMSTQGLKRAQKAEMNKKMLEKKRAEDRAREEALEKKMAKCKSKDCNAGPYDQSHLFTK